MDKETARTQTIDDFTMAFELFVDDDADGDPDEWRKMIDAVIARYESYRQTGDHITTADTEGGEQE